MIHILSLVIMLYVMITPIPFNEGANIKNTRGLINNFIKRVYVSMNVYGCMGYIGCIYVYMYIYSSMCKTIY